MKTNYLGINDEHNDFFTEVHLLVSKLVLVVEIYSLEVHALIIFTRQTLNRVPHNQHKMRCF